jgi:hypothetical protein
LNNATLCDFIFLAIKMSMLPDDIGMVLKETILVIRNLCLEKDEKLTFMNIEKQYQLRIPGN